MSRKPTRVNRIIRRAGHACYLNEYQMVIIAALTLLNVVALLQGRGEDAPVFAWIIALLLWPAVAFAVNYADNAKR